MNTKTEVRLVILCDKALPLACSIPANESLLPIQNQAYGKKGSRSSVGLIMEVLLIWRNPSTSIVTESDPLLLTAAC